MINPIRLVQKIGLARPIRVEPRTRTEIPAGAGLAGQHRMRIIIDQHLFTITNRAQTMGDFKEYNTMVRMSIAITAPRTTTQRTTGTRPFHQEADSKETMVVAETIGTKIETIKAIWYRKILTTITHWAIHYLII